jgi:hypothetical protein
MKIYPKERTMEQEILKHSRKIFSIFKESNQSFIKKAKEIVIEIFIIVFAITFSIWLHSVTEYNKEQKEVKTFLTNIRKDLISDLNWLKSDAKTYKEANEEYKSISRLTPSKMDSMNRANSFDIKFPMHIFMDKINNANYEGFKSSGKIGNIENDELRMAILGYYQQDAPATIESSNLYNQYLLKTTDALIEHVDQTDNEFYLSPQFKSKMEYLVMLGDMVIKCYEENSIKHATDILKKIDEELAK